MKKIILSVILFYTLSVLLYGFQHTSGQVNAQTKGPLSCQELEKILNSKECPQWAIYELGLWCAQSFGELVYLPAEGDAVSLYKNRPPDYTLLSDDISCLDEEDAQKDQSQKPTDQQKTTPPVKDLKGNRESKPLFGIDKIPVFIGEWFEAVSTGITLREFFYEMQVFADEATFGRKRREIAEEEEEREQAKLDMFLKTEEKRLNDEALWQFGVDPKEILERKPKLAEVDIDTLIRQERQSDSPYRLDILKGQAMIKYPNGYDWEPLTAEDKIPPGSTIFTSVDTTTVLSIQNKGVVQILPFTEITISEEGLKQAAEMGKTTTSIELRRGEIEVNIESGVFTAPLLQVHTPSVVAGVRGTHFWVSYDKDKKYSLVGVYEGQVEIKSAGSKESTTVSPDGDKPGVVLVIQKLSIRKLILVGAVLISFIAGVFLLLKRRKKR